MTFNKKKHQYKLKKLNLICLVSTYINWLRAVGRSEISGGKVVMVWVMGIIYRPDRKIANWSAKKGGGGDQPPSPPPPPRFRQSWLYNQGDIRHVIHPQRSVSLRSPDTNWTNRVLAYLTVGLTYANWQTAVSVCCKHANQINKNYKKTRHKSEGKKTTKETIWAHAIVTYIFRVVTWEQKCSNDPNIVCVA